MQAVWTANDAAGRAVDEVTAIGERLAALTDYADLLAEYDRNLADIRDAVANLLSAADCSEASYYRWVIDYKLDAIADLDSRRLDADAADVQAESEALAGAQQNAQAALDQLEDAIAALPTGMESTPRATITAEQVATPRRRRSCTSSSSPTVEKFSATSSAIAVTWSPTRLRR